MKMVSKMLALAVVLAILATASITALAEYGSGSVASGQTYTTEQMLTYAIQDEYMAMAEYQAIVEKLGASRPFSNLIMAEQRHIDLLKPLFAAYGVAVPENDAASRVTLPDTLAFAYEAGIKAETDNIAMYDAFLGQDLPDDVKAMFTLLKAASQNHLAAFEQNTGRMGNARMGNRMGNGMGNRMGGNGRGNGGANGCGRGNGGSGACGNYANCPMNPAA